MLGTLEVLTPGTQESLSFLLNSEHTLGEPPELYENMGVPLQQHLCSSEGLLKRKWAGIFHQGSNDAEWNVLYPLVSGEECMPRNGSAITGSSTHILSLLIKWQVTRYAAQQALETLE